MEGSYNFGEPSGVFKDFYPNGNISKEQNWKNGELFGPYKYYYDSGQIREKGNYIGGFVENYSIYDGKILTYHLNGQISSETLYKNGKIIGIQKFYDQKGNLLSQTTY